MRSNPLVPRRLGGSVEIARALARRVALALAAASMLFLAAGQRALACGGTPPPPFCGKSVVLGQALPGTVVLTGGGTLSVPTSVFLQLTSFGGAPCPPAPFTVKVTVTVTCPITGVSMGMTTVPIGAGYNAVTVPVMIPAGPPRVCSLSATAVVTFADGTAITTNAVSKDFCVVAPAPGTVSTPRLEIQPVTGPIIRVHPGDQARHRYTVRNNDPMFTFTGSIMADSEGNARLVTSSGLPEVQGNGPYTISDPTAGDNFPIGFGPLPPPACVPLPPNPGDPMIPIEILPLTLAPGETRTIDLFSRPWGMCANGSCAKSRIKLTGTFSDGTAGLACTAAITYADTAVAPVYRWLDGGAVGNVNVTVGLPHVFIQHRPHPDLFITTTTRTLGAQGMAQPSGLPFTMNFTPRASSGYGLLDGLASFPPLLDSFFDIFVDVEFRIAEPLHVLTVQGIGIAPGVPHGFENLYPMAMGTLGIRGPATSGPARTVDSFFDVFFQVSLDGIDQQNRRAPLQVLNSTMMPLSPTTARLHLLATRGAPTDGEEGPGFPLVGLNLRLIERGFSRPGDFLFCPGDTNGDSLVNFADLNQVLSQFGQVGPGLAGDIDNDGDVDFADLNFVLANFGRNCGPAN